MRNIRKQRLFSGFNIEDAAERTRSIYLRVDFLCRLDSLFNPLVRFVFFKCLTAEHERNTVHDE